MEAELLTNMFLMDNAEQCHVVHFGAEKGRVLVAMAHEQCCSGLFFSVS